MDLFSQHLSHHHTPSTPLAERLRPKTLDEFVGQTHLLGDKKILRNLFQSKTLFPMILWGPPGSGKTTLANLLARETASEFIAISAVTANVKDLKEIMQAAQERLKLYRKKTILFIDEIHRFSKSQQDVLMPDVEAGNPILIGTTTHNPFFYVNAALLSRSQVFEFKKLSDDDVINIIKTTLSDMENGLGNVRVNIDDDAIKHLAKVAEGDARRALSALEVGALTTPAGGDRSIRFTLKVAEESIQKKAVVYDADGDQHYDTISAFIKSVRGSDPHAAVYWLAKMLYAGEDPRFIARRLIILAVEDIGNADPRGLLLAVAAKEAVEFVGMPEARIILSQAVTYLSSAPKSNASYLAIEKALSDVKEGKVLPVPKPLRGASYAGAKRLGHTGYKYAHDYKGHFVDQEYMPSSAVYYEPTGQGYEETISQRMAQWKKEDAKAQSSKAVKPE